MPSAVTASRAERLEPSEIKMRFDADITELNYVHPMEDESKPSGWVEDLHLLAAGPARHTTKPPCGGRFRYSAKTYQFAWFPAGSYGRSVSSMTQSRMPFGVRRAKHCGIAGWTAKDKVTFIGSAQEFVGTRILGRFLKNDEFGLCDRHALSLQ